MFNFLELDTVYLILHLLGIALGAGGAFMSGAIFHFLHMPRLVRYADRSFARDDSFWRGNRSLFVSGGISGISWVCVIILGALRTTPFSYVEIILFYAALLLASILGALVLR